MSANGSKIECHGEIHTSLIMPGLRRQFNWTFVVADISNPLLGFDFLNHFQLLVDCHKKLLLDKETSRSASTNLYEREISKVTINHLPSHPPFVQNLFIKYPSILSPRNSNNENVQIAITAGKRK